MSLKTLQFCAVLETHLDQHLFAVDDDYLKPALAGAGAVGAVAGGIKANSMIKNRMGGLNAIRSAGDPRVGYAGAAGDLMRDAFGSVKSGASQVRGAVTPGMTDAAAKLKALFKPVAKSAAKVLSSRARIFALASKCEEIALALKPVMSQDEKGNLHALNPDGTSRQITGLPMSGAQKLVVGGLAVGGVGALGAGIHHAAKGAGGYKAVGAAASARAHGVVDPLAARASATANTVRGTFTKSREVFGLSPVKSAIRAARKGARTLVR